MYFYGRAYAQIQRGAYMHWREGYIYVELVGLIKVVEYSWLEGVREEYEQVREVRGGGHAYLERDLHEWGVKGYI